MNHLSEKTIYCPYCGEPIEVLIDPSQANSRYIEDCQVCCRPIIFSLSHDLSLAVHTENEN